MHDGHAEARVAQTGFHTLVRPLQLLSVLGVDAASPSVLMQGLQASHMQGLLPMRGLRASRSTRVTLVHVQTARIAAPSCVCHCFVQDLDVMWLDCVFAALKVPVQLAHHVSGKTLYTASLELSVGIQLYVCQLLSRDMFIPR